MTVEASVAFVEKWLEREPWHRLLLLFEPTSIRQRLGLVEALGHELRSAALDSTDAGVAEAKLSWWAQEWQQLAEGRPRHPLTQALHGVAEATIDSDDGAEWIESALALADDRADADLAGCRQRWQRYACAQIQAIRPWLSGASDDAAGLSLSLLVERLPNVAVDLERGRLSLPLSSLAEAGLTRAELGRDPTLAARALAVHATALHQALSVVADSVHSPYRRTQAVLARVLAARVTRRAQLAWSGGRPLPRLRAVFAVWRARRMTSVTGSDVSIR